LANSIVKAVENSKFVKDFLLPSINEFSFRLEISRDTVEKAYRHLKKIGVINSVPGKGYYISNVDFKHKLKIFLLFNKLSAHKKMYMMLSFPRLAMLYLLIFTFTTRHSSRLHRHIRKFRKGYL
jgi:DNA-binding FadR family transcriptional regulator